MQAILTKVLEIAPSDARVVILGETATGKGLLARTIHALSRRHAKPFVDVYCGAVATSLLESGIGLPQCGGHLRRRTPEKVEAISRSCANFGPGFQTSASPSIIVTGFLASGSQALLEGKREDHACVATSAEAYLRKRAAAPRV
jgi:sigma-54 interacting transcriptional regulator